MCSYMRTVETERGFSDHCFRTGNDVGRCQYANSDILEPEYCRHNQGA